MSAREEMYHHTREQVQTAVSLALEICDDLKLDRAQMEVLLPTVVGLLAAKSITVTQAVPASAFDLGNIGRHSVR